MTAMQALRILVRRDVGISIDAVREAALRIGLEELYGKEAKRLMKKPKGKGGKKC